MSILDSPVFFKAYAEETVGELWKQDIIRDFKDDIEYIDGKKHGTPRPNYDKKNFNDQIEFYAEQYTEEYLLMIGDYGIDTMNKFQQEYKKIEKKHHELMSKYRIKMRDYVKSKQSIQG